MKSEISSRLNHTAWDWLAARPLPFILGLSVILRVAVALTMGEQVVDLPGIFDQISYHNLAMRVLDGHGFSFGQPWWPITPADAPTAHWSFLYTFYLAGVYWIFGPYPTVARVLQAIVVGIFHPYITYRLAEMLFSKKIGLVAAAITAVYAYFFYYAAALMTESFYITLILLSLFLAMQLAQSSGGSRDIKLGILLGIFIGVTLLLRQVFLLFVPFLFLWMWITRAKRGYSVPIAPTILSITVIILFIVPVTLYNYSRFGRVVLLNTNSGYAFFWGNHPIYGTKFIPILPEGAYQELIPLEVRNLDEAALDQELLRRGVDIVLDNPGRYFLLSLSRIPAYFMFWPSADSEILSNISRVASFGITWPFMAYGLILAFRQSVREKGSGLLNLICTPAGLVMVFVFIYSAIHLLTWALIRYRLPVDAALIPFAALGLVNVTQQANAFRAGRKRYIPA